MSKKFTFFILSNSGAPVKQATLSKKNLIFVGVFAVFFTAVTLFSVLDYARLKFTNDNPYKLRQNVEEFQSEIEAQRAQIQKYANEINALKSKLLDLNDFEKRLRIIANIEKSDSQNSLFGIGGAIPEDLDTNIMTSEKHSSLLRDMNEQVDEIDSALDKQDEGFADLYEFIEEQKNMLASTPAIRPTTGWVSSQFGYRISPFTGRRSFHKGLDIANRKNSPIIAPADGVVSFAAPKGNMGLMIVIDHGHGMITRYGHLAKVEVTMGKAVKRGDIIALMGNSGRSTGPHLHYEVRLNGIPVNPVKYILD
ncbi:MAG: peptidoglycan DD-metalloendopeptidase family protein [Proteobacteria bacterium]|nr:peptidoglycan DD-metalloendopeptidase family protein [Pseudomonadota bacterium]